MKKVLKNTIDETTFRFLLICVHAGYISGAMVHIIIYLVEQYLDAMTL